MRFISTQVHGVLDYLIGIILIAAPWILGFAEVEMATWVPVVIGVLVIAYSLITAYELGIADVIPMPTHLWLDALGGLVLLISPWLFGFAGEVWIPHVVFGVLEVGAALMTRIEPSMGPVRM